MKTRSKHRGTVWTQRPVFDGLNLVPGPIYFVACDCCGDRRDICYDEEYFDGGPGKRAHVRCVEETKAT